MKSDPPTLSSLNVAVRRTFFLYLIKFKKVTGYNKRGSSTNYLILT